MSASAVGKKKSSEQIEKMKQFRHTESSKKKMSETQKGKSPSPETRAKMSEARKGKKKPDGFGEKISAALKGKSKGLMSELVKQQISNSLKGKNTHRKGKIGEYKHSVEAKAKISESNRKRIYSEETRAKISEGVKATQLRKKSAMSI